MSFFLSAAAQPFVPGQSWSHNEPPQQPWSGDSPREFVPGKPWQGSYAPYQTNSPQWSNGDDQSPHINNQFNRDTVAMVKDILYDLSMNPGLFDDVMKSLVEMLNGSIRTEQDMSTVADIIFEQSVLEPNFRYTGAKACDYLTSHLVLPATVNKFRSHINQRVKDAVESREEMAKDASKMARLHGVTMFLAELFLTTELQVQGGNPPQRIKVYRLALKELMVSLVNNASSGNLKCLGLLLKLSGKEIEDYDREQNNSKVSEQLNEIFSKARLHVISEAIDKNVRELWLQLIELRAKKWGQSETAAYGNPAVPPPAGSSGVYMSAGGDTASSAVFNSEPVFYNAQGQVISASEAGFGDEYDADLENFAFYQNYDESGPAGAYTEYTSSADPYAEYDLDPSHYQQGASTEPDYADDLEDLDAEIQAAFSDFLIETGQGDHS